MNSDYCFEKWEYAYDLSGDNLSGRVSGEPKL